MPVDSKARLAQDNPFSRGTLSVTSEESSRRHVLERAFDWRTDTRWKATDAVTQIIESLGVPGDGPFDYLAIAGHNLGTVEATVKFQTRPDSSTAWADAMTATVPSSDDPLLFLFTEVSDQDARVIFENPNGIPEAAVISAGKIDVFPQGVLPPVAPAGLNKEDEIIGGDTEGGELIGARKKRTRAEEQLQFDFVDPAWIRGTWKPLREKLREQGCFVAWNHDNYSDEVIYGFIRNDRAEHDGPFFMTLSFTVRGKA